MTNEIFGVRMTSVTLVRYRQLKGGRRIVQNHRIVPCTVALNPDANGAFTVNINTRRLRAMIKGTLINDTIHVDQWKVYELKTPYLRKGFNTIAGFNLSANMDKL